MQVRFLSCILLIVVLSTIGCQRRLQYQKITENEALRFGEKLAFAVTNKKTDRLKGISSSEAFAEQIAIHAFVDEPNNTINSLAESASIEKIIIETLDLGQNWQLLNSFEKEGKRYIRIRSNGINGFNYLDYMLCKVEDKLLLADCYVFKMGEYLSEAIWQSHKESSGNERKQSKQKSYFQDLKAAMKQYLKKGEYITTLEAYEKLPESIQSNKHVIHMALQAALALEDTATFNPLYHTYIALHYTVTDRAMLDLEYAFANGLFEKARTAIDKIDSLVGGDKWLEHFRGVVYVYEGEDEKAIEAFQRFLKVNDSYGDTHYWLTVLYARNGQYDIAKEHLHYFRRSEEFDGTAEDELVKMFPELDGR